jgi:uncharacterized membrane protein
LSNPYAPPKSAVAEAPEAPSRSVRLLRAAAIVGDALVALIPVLALFGSRRPDVGYLVAAAVIFTFSGVSIAGLLRPGVRAWFWCAMLVNIFAIVGLGYLLFFSGARNTAFAPVVIILAILNATAIGELRRARRTTG